MSQSCLPCTRSRSHELMIYSSRATRITTDLSQMKMQDPEALAREAEERENEDRQDALAEVISSLDLPEPERMVRAGMRADGRKTPDAQCVRSLLLSLQNPTDGDAQAAHRSWTHHLSSRFAYHCPRTLAQAASRSRLHLCRGRTEAEDAARGRRRHRDARPSRHL